MKKIKILRAFLCICLLCACQNRANYDNAVVSQRSDEDIRNAEITMASSQPARQTEIIAIELAHEMSGNASRFYALAVADCFYFLDGADRNNTLYKYDGDGNKIASVALGELTQVIRIQSIRDQIVVLHYDGVVICSENLEITQRILFQERLWDSDNFNYDIDENIECLYTGIYRINLQTGERTEIFPANPESPRIERILGESLLCIRYSPSYQYLISDLAGNIQTVIDSEEQSIHLYSHENIMNGSVFIYNDSVISGVYNLISNTQFDVEIEDNRSAIIGSSVSVAAMNTTHICYIDLNNRIIVADIETGSKTIVAALPVDSVAPIYILAMNENNQVLYSDSRLYENETGCHVYIAG